MKNGFTASILEHADRVGLHLSQEQANLCRMHIELMLEWNRRFNLTRITGEEDTIVKHLLDSMLPASALPVSGYALDVGTGAGFPGIPLKILHPSLEFTLLDSSRKKVTYLSVVAAELGLQRIHPVHGRWEDFAQAPGNRTKFDLITMRAVKLEPRHLSVLANRILRKDGMFAWWAGPESGMPAVEPSAGLTPLEPYSYTLPGISRSRSVFIWKKTGSSSAMATPKAARTGGR